jgi:hypothetical protein
MRRKGASIIEVLVICTVLVVLMFLMVKPTRALFVDMHHTQKDFESNFVVHNVLSQIQKDIEGSISANKDAADPNAFILETDSGPIRYSFGNEQVIKLGPGEKTDVWTIPHAVVKLDVWQREEKCYAVEFTKSIERKVLGKWEKKLSNSYVYFVGAGNSGGRQ